MVLLVENEGGRWGAVYAHCGTHVLRHAVSRERVCMPRVSSEGR